MFSWITNKLYAAGAILITALILLAGYFKDRGDRWKEKAKQREAALKRKAEIEENISEVDQTFSHRAAERNREKQNEPKKVPDRLRRNNDF